MPAFDLAEHTAALSRFDVVGQHSDEVTGFVRHVALFSQDSSDVNHGDTVDVVHMAPPLKTGDPLCVQVAGSIPLTNDEVRGIEAWFAKIKDEYQAQGARWRQQYIIDPLWQEIRDEKTGVRRYRKYSCAGFVLDAHLRVDVSLLVFDRQALPEVTRETLEAVYSDVFRSPALREQCGLPGDGPWRVVLAGYILHAMDRSGDAIRQEPYTVQPGDEFF